MGQYMKTNIFISMRYVLSLLICSVIFSGCASFPNQGFPKYSYDQLKPQETKPLVDYDLNYEWSNNRAKPDVLELFHEDMKQVFAKSNLFSKCSPGKGNSDYHFSIFMKNEGDNTSTQLSGIISGLTLTLIPVKVTDEFILTVDVKKGDNVIKQYQYKHSIDTWIQLFLVFMTPSHSPIKTLHQTWEDMLLAFLHDFEKDYILITK